MSQFNVWEIYVEGFPRAVKGLRLNGVKIPADDIRLISRQNGLDEVKDCIHISIPINDLVSRDSIVCWTDDSELVIPREAYLPKPAQKLQPVAETSAECSRILEI
jgi:hypothetical protein